MARERTNTVIIAPLSEGGDTRQQGFVKLNSEIDRVFTFLNDDTNAINEAIIDISGIANDAEQSATNAATSATNALTYKNFAEEAAEMAANALAGQTVLGNNQVTLKLKSVELKSVSADESATLGSELIDGTGWTSDGWTGSFDTGFTHTTGQVTPLVRTLSATGTNLYQVSMTVSSPTSNCDFSVSLGNSVPPVTYEGAGTLYTYKWGIQSISDGNLIITPLATFDGTITNISVKQIIGTALPTMLIKDSEGANSLEIRPTLADLKNTFIGIDSGKTNTSGHENVAIGNNAFSSNTSGFWNTAIGKDSLSANTQGSRNIAVGYLTLNDNTVGDRNIAIGTYTLEKNTSGRQNLGMGADVLWVNTTGSQNISLGCGSLYSNTTGNYNVAIGVDAINSNATGSKNVAIGSLSLYYGTTASECVAIGFQALYKNQSSNIVGIGSAALSQNTTGMANVGVGTGALRNNQTGTSNVAIGVNAGASVTFNSISDCTLIGSSAGSALLTGGDKNTFIGSSAGSATTTGTRNILIGYNSQAPTAVTNSYLNIGNVLKGDMSFATTNPIVGVGTVYSRSGYGARLQIGVGSYTSYLELCTNTTTDSQIAGYIGFYNENNGDTGPSTRKYIGSIQCKTLVNDSNSALDSGGILSINAKPSGGTATDVVAITANGMAIGFGIAAPTAKLHLQHGTVAAGTAPIKLTTGSLMTTPEVGAIEFDGTNLYFTRSDGTRKTIAVVA